MLCLGMGLPITLKAGVKLPGWLWGAIYSSVVRQTIYLIKLMIFFHNVITALCTAKNSRERLMRNYESTKWSVILPCSYILSYEWRKRNHTVCIVVIQWSYIWKWGFCQAHKANTPVHQHHPMWSMAWTAIIALPIFFAFMTYAHAYYTLTFNVWNSSMLSNLCKKILSHGTCHFWW